MRVDPFLVLGILALSGLFTLWIYPVLRTPALAKNPEAITGALSDAVASSLYREVNGQDLFASEEESGLRGDSRLCASGELSGPVLTRRRCRFARSDGFLDCRNAYYCAALRVDPTILADKRLRAAVLSALVGPCRALPEASGIPNEPVVSTLTHPLYLDRLILHCDRGGPVRPRIRSVDPSTGVIRLGL